MMFFLVSMCVVIYSASALSIRSPDKEHPACPENESHSGCELPCSALNSSEIIDCIDIHTTDRCVCKRDYYRNTEGRCVFPNQCPEAQCPPNTHWSRDASCKGYHCDGTSCPRRRPGPFKPGCICDVGYMVHPDGRCVKPEQCKSCPPNEIYSACWRCSEATCEDLSLDCGCRCRNQGCTCRSGFVRNGDGKCVTKADCPATKCPPNEVYRTCGNRCNEAKCKMPSGQPVMCPAVCQQGCFCRWSYARNEEGRCLPVYNGRCVDRATRPQA